MNWVVKIGGSLCRHPQLPEIVKHATDFAVPPLIVAGGGVFADQVRSVQQQWRFNDVAAHRMALLGMKQYAILLAELSGFPLQTELLNSKHTDDMPRVWMPNETQISNTLPRDWTVTSDSIAADLAMQLSAEHLLLVKSAAVVPGRHINSLVDDYFPQIDTTGFSVALVSAEQWLAQQHVK